MKEDLLQARCIREHQFQLDVPNKLLSGHIHGPHDSGDLRTTMKLTFVRKCYDFGDQLEFSIKSWFVYYQILSK